MKRALSAVLVAASLCTALVVARVAAQGGARPAQPAASAQTPRTWYLVNVITVKRGKAAEWVEFQKSQTIPMQQKSGMKQRETWQSGAPFGQGSTYAVVTQIDKFADYDQPPLPQRMLTGDALRTFQDTNNSLVESNMAFAIQDRAELSIMPAASASVRGAILSDVTVVGGHADQYEAYLKNDLVPVLKKGGVLGYLVSRTVFGGNANEYHTVQLFDSYADIDKGPVPTRVLGQAGAQALTAKAVPHVANLTRTLMRFVPELSFRARPTS